MIATIEKLNRTEGRGLREIEKLEEGPLGTFLADTRLLDQRYLPGATNSAGQRIRPRHLAIVGAVVGLGIIGWFALRRMYRR